MYAIVIEEDGSCCDCHCRLDFVLLEGPTTLNEAVESARKKLQDLNLLSYVDVLKSVKLVELKRELPIEDWLFTLKQEHLMAHGQAKEDGDRALYERLKAKFEAK